MEAPPSPCACSVHVCQMAEVISGLLSLQCDATPALFNDIFGSCGNHLMQKLDHYDGNILWLWSSLDMGNRGKLVAYLARDRRASLVFEELA